MKPAEFPESNVVFAKEQSQYLPLPAFLAPRDLTGLVITKWRGSWRERLRFLWTGEMWLRTLSFKKPLQPVRLQVVSPFPAKGRISPGWHSLVFSKK